MIRAGEVTGGTPVIITDAFGTEYATVALSGIEGRCEGHTFPVVWVERPLKAGGTDRCPWPLESVRLAGEPQ